MAAESCRCTSTSGKECEVSEREIQGPEDSPAYRRIGLVK